MGEFKFRIPDFWDLESRHARTIHLIGLDGIPRPCSVDQQGDLLTITRNQNESAKTYISYPFAEFGELTICTGTLLESEKPYDLVTELARGTLNRLRNQTSIWREGGLEIPPEVIELTTQGIKALGAAIVGQGNSNQQPAQDALDCAMKGIFALCEKFGEQISQFRVSQTEIPTFWQAASLSDQIEESPIHSSFDLLQISSRNRLETLQSRTIIGPLLDASPMSSFGIESENFQEGRQKLLDDLDQTLEQIQDNVSLIHAACGLNGIGHRHLSYRQQLQLTSDMLSRIEDSSCDLPVMVSFDYPWAERLAWSVGGAHPLQIAEDLMRNGSQISMVGLDINLDYWPGGSVARDPLQWIDLIDIWCQLGLPVALCLRAPNASRDEEELERPAMLPIELAVGKGDQPTVANTKDSDTKDFTIRKRTDNKVRENMTHVQRGRLLETILKIAVARPAVHGVIWRQWSDSDDTRYPDAGLVDHGGSEKSTLASIRSLRSDTLKRT